MHRRSQELETLSLGASETLSDFQILPGLCLKVGCVSHIPENAKDPYYFRGDPSKQGWSDPPNPKPKCQVDIASLPLRGPAQARLCAAAKAAAGQRLKLRLE